MISPEKLIDMNVLSSDNLDLLIGGTKFHADYVSFKEVKEFKEKLLKKSFENFQNSTNYKEILDKFYADESFWIDDFILFMIIKSQVKSRSFFNDKYLDCDSVRRIVMERMAVSVMSS